MKLKILALLLISLSVDAKPLTQQQAMDNVAACFHFAGEFSGDGSAHDKYVARQQKQYCRRDQWVWLVKLYRQHPNDVQLSTALLQINSLGGAQSLSAQDIKRMCVLAKDEFACD